jgi:hypothetical protein
MEIPFFDDEGHMVATLRLLHYVLPEGDQMVSLSLLEGTEEITRLTVKSKVNFFDRIEGDRTPQDKIIRYGKILRDSALRMVDEKNERNRKRRDNEFRARLNRMTLAEATNVIGGYLGGKE